MRKLIKKLLKPIIEEIMNEGIKTDVKLDGSIYASGKIESFTIMNTNRRKL